MLLYLLREVFHQLLRFESLFHVYSIVSVSDIGWEMSLLNLRYYFAYYLRQT